jgi:hypothetical protein
MRSIATALFTCAVLFSAAQDKIYQIKPGERLSDVLTSEDIYLYPAFRVGHVIFKSNETSGGRLNLSFVTGELHFIDNKGDTLALDNEQTIRQINIGKDTFYYHEGYLRQLAAGQHWKLAQKQEIRLVKEEKSGAYDQSMPSGAVSYTSIRAGNQLMDNLIVRENTTLMRQTEYFIGDKYNRFVLLNRKNILKLFAKHAKQVEAYLQANPVNFKKEEEVQKVFAFLQTL